MEEIAIIGIGCKLPGADNIDEFWRVLKNGENHVLEVPKERWNLEAFYDPDPNAPGKTYVRRAGFIKNHDAWDNKVYGVNDFEASQMDPQQRFVMDCCYKAMENAGITRKELDGSNTGVYIGVMNSDYKALQSTSSEHMNNYTLTGTSTSIIASRISFNYNLVGPSLTLDTACSSSLLAIHLAAQALREGDCKLAFAGGVNSLMSPGIFVQLSKARMASPTGYCQAFSNKADGYARGEGAGIILLKRLKDAERDNDPIWATIMTGCNQDGHTVTPMTAPSGSQQHELLKTVYGKFNIDPDKLEYIEAHGTGTQAGDPVEANCLGGFLANHTKNAPRYIGSVKTNIGHLESAAGVAGVIKVLLMQKYSTIVPTLHFDVPNEKIDFDKLKLIVATSVDQWPTYNDDGSKLSCVNSFSFGGTNCHAILKSYVRPKTRNEVKFGIDRRHIICFSGTDDWSLKSSIEHFTEHAKSRPFAVSDIAFTSTLKRDHYSIRHAIVVETMEDAVNQLEVTTPTKVPAKALQKRKYIIFVFGGMGSTWKGMCKEIMRTNDIFKEKISEIDSLLHPLTGWSIKKRFEEDFEPTDPYFGPIASFTCQVALDAVWKHWGVQPDCIIGQSIGEVAAAHASGALSLKAAVDVIYHRTYQQAKAVGGAMLVVGNYAVSEVEKMLSEYPGKVVAAVHNSPISCTISGDSDVVQAVKERLEDIMRTQDIQILLHPLQVTSAFHSHHMEECSQKIKSALAGLDGQKPSVKLYSTVSGKEATTADFVTADYWAKNVREPVLFRQALQDSVNPDCFNVFLEIGSKPVLKAHAKDNFDEESCQVFASMKKDTDESFMMQTLGHLYVHGVEPKWENIIEERGNVTDIPQYQFHQRQNLIIPEQSRLSLMGGDFSGSSHPFLSPILGEKKSYKVMINPTKIGSVYEHFVMGTILLPGALYGEVGLAIADHMTQGRVFQMAVSVDFKAPLALYSGQSQELDVATRTEEDFKTEKVRTVYTVTKDNQTVAVGSIAEAEDSEREVIDIDEIKDRCDIEMPVDEIYGELKGMGFVYGTPMRVLSEAFRNDDECVVYMRLPEEIRAERVGTYLHPAILDGMLQTPGVLAEVGEDGNVVEILPVGIGHLIVRRTPQDYMVCYGRVIKRTEVSTHYDVILLSPDGEIIAEARNFATQKLGVVSDKKQMVFNINWKSLGPLPIIEEVDFEEWAKILVLSSAPSPGFPGSNVIQLTSTESIADQLGHKSDIQNSRAVVYISNRDYSKLLVADDIFDHVLEECMQIKELVLLFMTKRIKCPLYLITRNVWLVNCKNNDIDICSATPSGAALWGMLRTVGRELPEIDVKLVDINGSDEMDKQSAVYSIVNFISQLEKDGIADSEFVFADGAIHSFEFLYASDSMEYKYKEVSMDDKCEAKLLSQNKNDYVSPFLSYCDVPKPISSVDVALKVDTMSIQNSLIYSTCIEHTIVNANTGGFPVICLEAIGYTNPDHPNEKYVSCYPTQAGTTVIVPKSCLIPADDLQYYSPGLMIKVVLMWSLSQHTGSSGVTVLYNSRTKALMQMLSLMLSSKKKEVQALSTDDLKSIENEDVISLVSLDKAAINEVICHWSNARSLSTVYSLIDNVSIAMIYDQLPHVAIQLLRTEEVYSPFMLLQNVPILGKWLQNNRQELGAINKSFKSGLLGRRRSSTTIPRSIDIMRLLSVSEIPFSKGIMLPPTRAVPGSLFRKDAAYIVVGGLTGLGWECVRFLANNGAGFIVCFNRRSPTDENLVNMQHLENTCSCRVAAIQVDVTSYQSVQKGFDNIENIFPGSEVKGVIFGAAVLKDSFIESMDRDKFATCLSPKVRGAWNLHLVTQNLSLDYFIMHSSVTSVLGNPGQTNYGAGNSFEDGLAHMRRAMGLPGQSLNWGPLDTGMLKQGESTDKVVKLLKQQGYELLELDEIHHCLMTSLIDDHPQMMLSKFDLGNFSSGNADSSALLAKFRAVLPTRSTAALGDDNLQDDGQRKLDIALIKTLEKDERLQTFEGYMALIACKVFAVDESMVTRDSSVLDLGIDSMLAMTIIDQVNKDTGFRIPMVLLLSEQSTISKLAESIEMGVWSDEDGPGDKQEKIRELPEPETKTKPVEEKVVESKQMPEPHEIAKEINPIVERSTDQISLQEKTQNISTSKRQTKEVPSKESLVSFIEKYICELDQQLSDKSHLHLIKDIIFRGKGLGADLIRLCAREVLERHTIARTRFMKTDHRHNKLTRAIGDSEPDFRLVANSTNEDKYLQLSQEHFDLKKYGPVRFIYSAEPSVRVRIVLHKIGFDSSSSLTFVSDFQTLVVNKASNKETPKLTMNNLLGSQEIEEIYRSKESKLRSFWLGKVPKAFGKNDLNCPEFIPSTPHHKTKTRKLDQTTSQNIHTYVNKMDTTLLNLFVSSYQLLLRCYSKSNDVAVMTNSNLRSTLSKKTDEVCNLTSDVPIFSQIESSSTLSSFLKSNLSNINSCLQNAVFPLSMIENMVTSAESRKNIKRHCVILEEIQKTIPPKNFATIHDTLLTVGSVQSTKAISLQLQCKNPNISDKLAEDLLNQLHQIVLMVISRSEISIREVAGELGLSINTGEEMKSLKIQSKENKKADMNNKINDKKEPVPDFKETRIRLTTDTLQSRLNALPTGTLSYSEYYFYYLYLRDNPLAHHLFTDIVTVKRAGSEEIWRNISIQLMKRHRCLRTTYVKADPEENFRFGYKKLEMDAEEIMDFQKVANSKNDAEFERLSKQPFDLSVKGGLRIIFAAQPSTRVRVVFHHTCIDFYTFGLILKDLRELGPAIGFGIDLPVSPSEPLLTSATLVEKALRPMENQLKEFWERKLKGGVPDIDLQKSPTNLQLKGQVKSIIEVLPKEMSEEILQLVPSLKCTVFRFFATINQMYFHFITGQDRILQSVPLDLRAHLPEARNYYENMATQVPIFTDFKDMGDKTVGDFITSNSQSIAQHLAHGLYPITLIWDMLEDKKDWRRLTRHSVVEEDVSTVSDINRTGFDVNVNPDLLGFSYETRLMVWLNKKTSYLKLVLECLPELFPETEARTHMSNIIKLTKAVLKDRSLTLSQLKGLIVPAEKAPEKKGETGKENVPSYFWSQNEEDQVGARFLKETRLGYDHLVFAKMTNDNGRQEIQWSSIGYRGKSKPKIFKRLSVNEITNAYLATYRGYRTLVIETNKRRYIFKFIEKSEVAGFTRSFTSMLEGSLLQSGNGKAPVICT